MKNLFLYTGLLLTLNAPLALAGDVSGVIDRITVVNDIVYFNTYPAPPERSACATNRYWHYTSPLVSEGDKANYAMMLSAYVSQSPITVRSRNTCNNVSDLEDLNYFISESRR
jgi:hypothetical protein